MKKIDWKDIAIVLGSILLSILGYYLHDTRSSNAAQWREISVIKESVACIKGKLGMPER